MNSRPGPAVKLVIWLPAAWLALALTGARLDVTLAAWLARALVAGGAAWLFLFWRTSPEHRNSEAMLWLGSNVMAAAALQLSPMSGSSSLAFIALLVAAVVAVSVYRTTTGPDVDR